MTKLIEVPVLHVIDAQGRLQHVPLHPEHTLDLADELLTRAIDQFNRVNAEIVGSGVVKRDTYAPKAQAQALAARKDFAILLQTVSFLIGESVK